MQNACLVGLCYKHVSGAYSFNACPLDRPGQYIIWVLSKETFFHFFVVIYTGLHLNNTGYFFDT